MDGLQVIVCLESLWFFTNVLSPTNNPLPLHKESTFQNQQSQSTNAETKAEVMTETVSMEVVAFQTSSTEKRKRERRRRRRSRRERISFNHPGRRFCFGEIGMGLDVKDAFSQTTNYLFGQSCGYGYEQYQNKIPPLNDSVAMKEHIKSWAYAVAFTVR